MWIYAHVQTFGQLFGVWFRHSGMARPRDFVLSGQTRVEVNLDAWCPEVSQTASPGLRLKLHRDLVDLLDFSFGARMKETVFEQIIKFHL